MILGQRQRLGGVLLALAAAVATGQTSNNTRWTGYLPIAYYESVGNCSGDADGGTGYSSSLHALGNGELCETDHLSFIEKGKNVTVPSFIKWVQVCGAPAPALPNAIYQYYLPCEDKDCTRCLKKPLAAVKISWSYFEDYPTSYPPCLRVESFDANTTDPSTEFANATSVPMTPSSELFSGTEEALNGYWSVFVENSCIIDGVNGSATTPAPMTPSPVTLAPAPTDAPVEIPTDAPVVETPTDAPITSRAVLLSHHAAASVMASLVVCLFW